VPLREYHIERDPEPVITRCFFCDSTNVRAQDLCHKNPTWTVMCFFCGARGPLCNTRQAAIKAWNQEV
jgi:hypothetical protein